MRDSSPTNEMTVPSVPLEAVTPRVAHGEQNLCFAFTVLFFYQYFWSQACYSFITSLVSPKADRLCAEVFPPGSDLRTDKPEGLVQSRLLAPETAGCSGRFQ